MTADFKQRIVNHQQNGDSLIIDEILYGATFDFASDPSRRVEQSSANKVVVHIKLNRPEHYISYRVQRLKNNALRSLNGEKLGTTEKELNRLLSMVYIDFGVKFECEILRFDGYLIEFKQDAKLIAAVDGKMDEIRENVYDSELAYFLEFYNYAKKQIEEREEMREQVEKGVHDNVINAIKHALKYVDTVKSEREIIVYLNKAITTKFGELELARNGLKRIYRRNNQGDLVSIHVKKQFPDDSYKAIMPELTANKVDKLTKRQSETVASLIKLIEKDKIAGNLAGYSCDRRGFAVIKRDYAADYLEIDYVSFRKLLSRIKGKVTN